MGIDTHIDTPCQYCVLKEEHAMYSMPCSVDFLVVFIGLLHWGWPGACFDATMHRL